MPARQFSLIWPKRVCLESIGLVPSWIITVVSVHTPSPSWTSHSPPPSAEWFKRATAQLEYSNKFPDSLYIVYPYPDIWVGCSMSKVCHGIQAIQWTRLFLPEISIQRTTTAITLWKQESSKSDLTMTRCFIPPISPLLHLPLPFAFERWALSIGSKFSFVRICSRLFVNPFCHPTLFTGYTCWVWASVLEKFAC